MLRIYIAPGITGKAYILVYKSGDLPIKYYKRNNGKVLAYWCKLELFLFYFFKLGAAMKTLAKIEIEKLVFPHEEKPALQNIDFEIYQGDFIVITALENRRWPNCLLAY